MSKEGNLAILKCWREFQWFGGNPAWGWDGNRVTKDILASHRWEIVTYCYSEIYLN